MNIQFITETAGTIVSEFIAPYGEAKRRVQLAFFRASNATEIQYAPSLSHRVVHLTTGLLLFFFPLFNNIFFIILRHLKWDCLHQFNEAIQSHDLDQLGVYLKADWNPNVWHGNKPLILKAYEENHRGVLESFLKSSQCNPDLKFHGHTLLHIVAEKGDEATADLLLSNGAHGNIKRKKDGYTAGGVAYVKGHHRLAALIAEKGNCVNEIVDGKSKTLLNIDWESPHKSICTELIRAGAKPPEKKPLAHDAVLKWIYKKGKTLVVDKMVDAGWDLNAIDENQGTLLEKVVENKDWEFARKLIANGVYIHTHKTGQRIIQFNHHQSDFSFYRDFLQIPSLKPQWGQRLNPLNWKWGDTFLASSISYVIQKCRENQRNPLEVVFFMASDVAMQELACQLTFSEFKECLEQFASEYPRISVRVILNSLYQVDKSHYRKFQKTPIDDPQIPAAEQNRGLLSTLTHEFDRLDLSDENDRTFEDKVWTKEDMMKGLRALIRGVKSKKELPTLPQNKKEREALYKKIEILLREIAFYIKGEAVDASMKKEILIELSFLHVCPQNWFEVAHRLYCIAAQKKYPFVTFYDRVMDDLALFRLQLVHEITKNEPDNNMLNFFLSKIGESRAIPSEVPDPEDVDELEFSQLELERFFDAHYVPVTIAEAVCEKRKLHPFFKEQMTHYFRDVLGPKWKEPPFDEIEKQVDLMKKRSLSAQEVKDFFASKGEEVPLRFPGGSPVTIEAGLKYLRFNACFKHVVSDNKESQPALLLGTAKMLQELQILKPRNSRIFGKSFKLPSFYERIRASVA